MNSALLLSVLGASFVGSLHCAVMCGGLTAVYAGSDGSSFRSRVVPHIGYHGARLVAYVTAGVAAGALGRSVDIFGAEFGLVRVAASVAGVIVISWAAVVFLQGTGTTIFKVHAPTRFGSLAANVLSRFRECSRASRALALGMVSAFLPCGWLYAFVIAAAGTGGAVSGGELMAVFWAGTVPALLGLSASVQALARRVGRRVPVVAASMLLAVGLSTVWARLSLPISSETLQPVLAGSVPAGAPCHGH